LALTLYLDTSVLPGFVETDAFADRAKSLFGGMGDVPIVSDFVATEFASRRGARNIRLVRQLASSIR
jgi:hypothetical protein